MVLKSRLLVSVKPYTSENGCECFFVLIYSRYARNHVSICRDACSEWKSLEVLRSGAYKPKVDLFQALAAIASGCIHYILLYFLCNREVGSTTKEFWHGHQTYVHGMEFTTTSIFGSWGVGVGRWGGGATAILKHTFFRKHKVWLCIQE